MKALSNVLPFKDVEKIVNSWPIVSIDQTIVGRENCVILNKKHVP
jgi:hypothetical protein